MSVPNIATGARYYTLVLNINTKITRLS